MNQPVKIVVTGLRGIPDVMGGIETHCEELYPLVAMRGYDVTVIRRENYAKSQEKEWCGVHLEDIPSPTRKSFETIVHTFKAINKAKKLNADILHIHAIGPSFWAPYAKLRGMKVVVTHHGPDYDREKWGLLAKTILKLGERFACKFADEIIVISEVIKGIIKDKYDRTNHVSLIYNGVKPGEKRDCPEYFEELGIEPQNYVLGMCRFVKEKNLHHLVEAFLQYKERTPDSTLKLVLAGDTDFEDDYSIGLKKLASDNGVVLTGFVKGDKKKSLLTHASCFVLPSSHEGLPIALLEAMSYQLPVIVSDIPANMEVGLSEDCYFHVRDISQLSEKIEKKLEQGNSVRVDYDMRKYKWESIAEQTCEVYERLSCEK